MHRDAGPPNWKFICINFHCGGLPLRCIYKIPKRSMDDQTDRHKITKYLRTTGRTDGQMDIFFYHSGDLNLYAAATRAAFNYELHE